MDIRAKIIERSGFEEVMSADGDCNASDYNTIKENIQNKQYSGRLRLLRTHTLVLEKVVKFFMTFFKNFMMTYSFLR